MVVRHDLDEGAEQATFPEEEAIRVSEQLGLHGGSRIRLRHPTDPSRKPLTIWSSRPSEELHDLSDPSSPALRILPEHGVASRQGD
jgi:hypothetical protein